MDRRKFLAAAGSFVAIGSLLERPRILEAAPRPARVWGTALPQAMRPDWRRRFQPAEVALCESSKLTYCSKHYVPTASI